MEGPFEIKKGLKNDNSNKDLFNYLIKIILTLLRVHLLR